MKTRPGMVLRDCGWLSITPTVERPFGRLPILRAATISSAAPTSASRRPSIGVVPAWLSMPVQEISYQRWPCAPVTTPIVLFSRSRIGPCSICASKKAPTGRPPTGSLPS